MSPIVPSALPHRPSPKEALLQQRYRDLVYKHLGKLLDKLFADFIGIHFHIVWMPTFSGRWSPRFLPTGSSAYCRLVAAEMARWAGCQACWPKHLAATLKSEHGHRFTCRLGLCNCWYPLRIRGQTLGIVYLQALDPSTVGSPARNRSVRALQERMRQAGASVMDRSAFTRAARLLHLIVQHLETSSLAELQTKELDNVQRMLHVFENVQRRLRKKLNRLMPAFREMPPVTQLESRPERMVHTMLDRIQGDYARPLTLRQCARDLRMNAAYLSHLFSHAVGLPFKTCLTEVRVEKARELLGDPAKNISQIASALGYASANRFRLAFKSVTGLSPRIWRETLHMHPLPTPSSST